MRPIKTWIVLADASRARIVENSGPGKGLFQTGNRTFEAQHPDRHTDQQGRTFNSVSPTRHKMESKCGEELELACHVNEIFGLLKDAFKNRQFERLILCAAPQTLGEMRDRIPDELKDRVIAEVPKDLTRVATDELSGHFESVLAV